MTQGTVAVMKDGLDDPGGLAVCLAISGLLLAAAAIRGLAMVVVSAVDIASARRKEAAAV